MKLYVFSVYDKVSKMYVDLFTSQTKEAAQRSFNSAGCNRGTMLAKYPQDFSLYCLGEFDNGVGSLVGFLVPDLVQNTVECPTLPPDEVSIMFPPLEGEEQEGGDDK